MSKSKLKNYSGRFCESDFENAFIAFLEQEGWTYLSGDKIVRNNQREVLIEKDLTDFLTSNNRHYKIFCVNGNTGFRNESRIFYFIHLQNEKDYERKESSSA